MMPTSIGWYNGWSPGERLATTPIQKQAVKDGRLHRPSHCSICGSSKQVWFHNERYDEPLNVYSICRACHRCLHERFDQPEPWIRLVAAHETSGAWFTLLSLDPGSRYTAYRNTYPEDLPRQAG